MSRGIDGYWRAWEAPGRGAGLGRSPPPPKARRVLVPWDFSCAFSRSRGTTFVASSLPRPWGISSSNTDPDKIWQEPFALPGTRCTGRVVRYVLPGVSCMARLTGARHMRKGVSFDAWQNPACRARKGGGFPHATGRVVPNWSRWACFQAMRVTAQRLQGPRKIFMDRAQATKKTGLATFSRGRSQGKSRDPSPGFSKSRSARWFCRWFNQWSGV